MHVQNHSARKTAAQFALSAADQKRLQPLAAAAESTPQRMLKFVLRDGFAYCEEFVRRVNAGLVSAQRGESGTPDQFKVLVQTPVPAPRLPSARIEHGPDIPVRNLPARA